MKEKNFIRKYFWEGQLLNESTVKIIPNNADFLERILITYRKYIGFLIPLVVMQTFWWLTAIRYDWLSLFETHWQLPAVMLIGSTIAGMTSEGGGAVAFPVMTLGLKISPIVARDFSLVIQAIGMSCSIFVIIFMNVQIELNTVVYGTMGSIPGFILGSHFIDPCLTASQKKMLFVSIWSSFALALYMLNGQKERETFPKIPQLSQWKVAVLCITGFVGGVFTAFAGSGVDICTFSIITLLFRVSEKTATPTTIVLMGLNSIVGVYYRAVWRAEVSELAWDYVKVTAPVAVTLAPFGSFLGSHFHRQILASFIYILEILAVLGFLATRPPLVLVVIGAGVVTLAFLFFTCITKAGQRLMEKEAKGNNQTEKHTMLEA